MPEKEEKKENIMVCFNCNREIDVYGLKEGSHFKCKECYKTLIVSPSYINLRKKFLNIINKGAIFGIIGGLIPMIILMGIATIYPFIIVPIYIILGIIILLSLKYFIKRASDIIVGIFFAEYGLYLNISSIILSKFGNSNYQLSLDKLNFSMYLLSAFSLFLIIWGLLSRKRYKLK